MTRFQREGYGRTYDHKPASTEDFKAIVGKHLTKRTDFDGNYKMDCFLCQYG